MLQLSRLRRPVAAILLAAALSACAAPPANLRSQSVPPTPLPVPTHTPPTPLVRQQPAPAQSAGGVAANAAAQPQRQTVAEPARARNAGAVRSATSHSHNLYGPPPKPAFMFATVRSPAQANVRMSADTSVQATLPLELLPEPPLVDEAWLLAASRSAARLVPVAQDEETNVRSGPGRAYPPVAQVGPAQALTLVARYEDWVQVSGSVEGWIRADLLRLPDGAVDALAVATDIPPPPPVWVWPSWGELTSPFGVRYVPFRSFHNGIDIANDAGTPIRAARAGWVVEAGWCSGYGYCVRIDHPGKMRTIYGHLLAKPNVRVGQEVAAGDLIGLMGSTYDAAGGGYSTGVHLHFTVMLDGVAVDPLKYLP